VEKVISGGTRYPMKVKAIGKQGGKWSRGSMRFHKDSSVKRRIIKASLILCLAVFLFSFLAVALHWGLNFCPFHFAKFQKSKAIPVVYGYPTPEGFIKALTGEIILGGCRTGCIGAVCPYCKWPVRFRSP